MAKIFYDFDPEEETGIKIPKAKRDEALDAVADYVKEEVLSTVGEGSSPVQGGKWKRTLTPKYKKLKGGLSSATFANMELNGDLLDSLDVVRKRGKTLRLTVGEDQMDKADGHNNFSGKSKLPAREFIPNEKKGQRLSAKIRAGIKSILQEYGDDEDSAPGSDSRESKSLSRSEEVEIADKYRNGDGIRGNDPLYTKPALARKYGITEAEVRAILDRVPFSKTPGRR